MIVMNFHAAKVWCNSQIDLSIFPVNWYIFPKIAFLLLVFAILRVFLRKIYRMEMPYFDWRESLSHRVAENRRIGDDLIILDSDDTIHAMNHPRKVEVSTFILVEKGESRVLIDGKEYRLQAPCIAVVMSNQTYHLLEVSADMSFRAVIMSRRFTDGLFGMYHQSHHLYRMIEENPIIDVSSDKVSFHTFFKILQQNVAVTHNPMRLESAQHLTLSMLYHYARRLEGVDAAKRKKDLVYERFCEDARRFFALQHHLSFYAIRLGVSGKYLTEVCKEKSGKTAADYIDALLLTECQALLLSTDLTINQIARRLHFPSPSVFGKFFKHLCGMTPTQYREETR